MTAEQEAEEKKRIQEFQDTILKMRSELRILTHFYQVAARATFRSSCQSFTPISCFAASSAFHISSTFPSLSSHASPSSFQSIVQQFLVLLMTSSDESLRFLSFRLDFNEHYRFALQNSVSRGTVIFNSVH